MFPWCNGKNMRLGNEEGVTLTSGHMSLQMWANYGTPQVGNKPCLLATYG